LRCYDSTDSHLFLAFWSYVSEAIPRRSAPKLFPFITTMGQLGSIFGPLIAGFCMVEFSFQFGTFLSYVLCGLVLFISTLFVYFFSRTVADTHQRNREDDNKEKKPEMTLREGLGLLWNDSYVRGIFAISTIYHIISTITDYQVSLSFTLLK
jgi:ATP/ADP translocase